MRISRREFCATGTGLMASGVMMGTASAQESIELSGFVQVDGDGDIGGNTIRFADTTTDERGEAGIESDGSFTLIVPGSGNYRVTVFSKSPEPDGVPVVYSFNDMSVSEGGNVGEFSIPEAYEVSVRFVDPDGNPVEGVPANFRAENGTGLPPEFFTTDAGGYVMYPGASTRGVELAGRTDIEILPDSGSPTLVQSVVIDSSSEFEFTIENPEQYRTGVVGSDERASTANSEADVGEGADEGARERGLFSNSGNEPDFISNPLNLTTAGFALSVLGIGYQLLEGR